jgi:ADP-ribose pyrophosphatase YjhB (NUDIX family)
VQAELLAFLKGLRPGPVEEIAWANGALPLRIATYLTGTMPPLAYVTSARAVVRRGDEVLVVEDGEGEHILPGGRREPGETVAETVVREVLEESGWEVRLGWLLGVLHFRHLGPPPAEHPFRQPDFLHVVFAAEAVAYLPERRQPDGYELGSDFRPIALVREMRLSAGERELLEAAFR